MKYDDPKERISIEKEGVSVRCEPFSRNFRSATVATTHCHRCQCHHCNHHQCHHHRHCHHHHQNDHQPHHIIIIIIIMSRQGKSNRHQLTLPYDRAVSALISFQTYFSYFFPNIVFLFLSKHISLISFQTDFSYFFPNIL